MTENKQVRVDNWGIFFLQRLQLFFSKTDYCDLTLQFQGNVQLKVHRLVLNACTEYFEMLERSGRLIDENVVLMPEMLQADVVVPIINFMYTGMLEYPIRLYQKLYQAAELMRISVLTKLLDAQKQSIGITKVDKRTKLKSTKPSFESTPVTSPVISPTRKQHSKSNLPELPSTLPGRKLPIWKRKNLPHSSSSSDFSPSEFKRRSDPLSFEDAAKPTRFEWPEDDIDLPPVDMMDVSYFGDISYTSKPLLREDDVKPILLHSPNEIIEPRVKEEIHEVNSMENISQHSSIREPREKRKLIEDSSDDKSPKRIKIIESENETTISVLFSNNSGNLDPTKIVSEILKKYPHLMKKKKSIKLKILSKPLEKDSPETKVHREKVEEKKIVQKVITQVSRPEPPAVKENVWSCKECCDNNGKPLEFLLYYLYRKHMTDVHYAKFDPRICKYCGVAFAKSELYSFHLFIKHGIKPSGNQVFPSCSQCPYVALSKQALQIHKSKHKKSERQCTDCKLAFNSNESIASHLQITGHMGKVKRNIYDCQYCMKSSQSAISLLIHIKSNHELEGRRDGIISLDEVDLEEGVDLDDHVEEGAAEGEYIVPEIRSPHPKKVKIISDVKVPPPKTVNRPEVVTLGSNNSTPVPTSIATSLGLLDIVVLDENQQLILQNPEEQAGQSRTEYILPQIAPRSVSDDTLGTTSDELVMVLTDQDYKEGHTGITSDNSNIVVLYSHPADGQQGQFITSQGNLMVNSETGLLEIRNGATIATTSANQIVMREENHIETIEMIQREINGSQTLKVEPIYEEDQKPQIQEIVEQSTNYVQITNSEESHSEEAEIISPPNDVEISKIPMAENESSPVEEVPVTQMNMMNESTESSSSIVSMEETGSQESTEVCADDSIEHQKSNPDISIDSEVNDSQSTITDAQLNEISTNEENVFVEELRSDHVEEEENAPQGQQDVMLRNDEIPMETETVSEDKSQEEVTKPEGNEVSHMEQPETVENKEADVVENSLKPVTEIQDTDTPYSPTDNPIDIECDIECYPDHSEKHDTESVNENEKTGELAQCEIQTAEQVNTEASGCEIGTDQAENDECSQSSQESSQVVNTDDTQDGGSGSPKDSTKISILDDWEDTDSQQSDNKSKLEKKGAQETVHKLMDDWEEEDVEK